MVIPNMYCIEHHFIFFSTIEYTLVAPVVSSKISQIAFEISPRVVLQENSW
jgi:hypothetical protein